MTDRLKPYPETSPEARALNICGDKWALLIVRELLAGPVRFIEIQRRLTGLDPRGRERHISTEQLRLRLNQMVADGLLTRTRYREAPPRVDYELTAKGQALEPTLQTLSAWAHEHAEPALAAA
jgi:DNA-binding HxlR family transcriptional regulator